MTRRKQANCGVVDKALRKIEDERLAILEGRGVSG